MSQTLRSQNAPPDFDRQVADAVRRNAPSVRFDCTAMGGSNAVVVWPEDEPMLTDVVSVFSGFGLPISAQKHLRVSPGEGSTASAFRLHFHQVGIADDAVPMIEQALQAVLSGVTKVDTYSRLVVAARMSWQEIVLVRAVCRFLVQAGIGLPETYLADSLVKNSRVPRLFVELLCARLDPRADRGDRAGVLESEFEGLIESTITMDEDRILRGIYQFARAVLRTNWFQRDSNGQRKKYVSFKLDSSVLNTTVSVVPFREIFVYSDAAEGVHVRSGLVSRGGLRWSDRVEDYRTEVLGLMKTQVVKNAPIVPVGAKGAFVVRDSSDAESLFAGYSTFVRGLLDLTDNIVDGAVVAPRDLICLDGDDPYLVVAADRGTAALSDVANEIASEYDFWLGDAFASGGSRGYDHKAMGITAGGAWLSVRRHLFEHGIDPDSDVMTVVGIGDMSGDVFGNGMLSSVRIRLVAAFDHRHIFLDPNPVEHAISERRRLFDLPGSCWADYDPALISEGGGVWPRDAKQIVLSRSARACLKVEATALTPDDLIKAILRAPVDVLWNGGIGTYIKSSHETAFQAADHANDSVRIDATDLRCAVIGEGGNLGMTQRARIEYALSGGRVNADFIDNAAGVATSDLEVNTKIALDDAVMSGTLDSEQRNLLLQSATESVSGAVLDDSDNQTLAISIAEYNSACLLDRHGRFIENLEHRGGLDRAAEVLPSRTELAIRARDGRGLTRPEIAVLLAQSKNLVRRELMQSTAPDNRVFERLLIEYFPPAIAAAVPAEVQRHRLRREIIATRLASDLINRAGPGLIFWLEERFGASTPTAALAYSVVSAVFDLDLMWTSAVADTAGVVEGHGKIDRVQSLIERATSWLLANRPIPIDPEIEIARYRELFAEMVYHNGDSSPLQIDHLEEFFGWAETSHQLSTEIDRVQSVYRELGAKLHLHWLADNLEVGNQPSHWHLMAIAAIRDELRDRHHALTAAVIREGGAANTVERWCSAHTEQVDRFIELSTTLRCLGPIDLSRACTVNAELRMLTRAVTDRP
ncbi:MAG: NAD-glutamate dehydrogenase domain-containing protein [Rhodococcus sp. (in: high G+C Gram-positive bacteria)]